MKTSFLLSAKNLHLIFFVMIFPVLSNAQWTAPVNISPKAISAGLNEDMGPCLAVSNDTLHVVWTDHRTHGWAIYYTHSIDTGKTWSKAIHITDTTGKASMPVIAVQGKNIHVVWMDSLKGIRASYYIHSLDGGITWGQKICLDTNTKFWPGVAVSGNTVLVSLDKSVSSTNTEVFLMRSLDNGITWSNEQQISNANGRSEDQSMTILGNDVHLSWNDNRNGGVMQIYYRHSSDLGVTWDPEFQLIHGPSGSNYSTMVCLDKNHVDVPAGDSRNGAFQVWIKQSADKGVTWATETPVSSGGNIGQAYPYMVRDSSNLYLVYLQFNSPTSAWYTHSGDGGVTWDSAMSLGNGGQPFIAYTGCVLHIIWPSANHTINYIRNPTGNCTNNATGINEQKNNSDPISVYPNPSNGITNLQIGGFENSTIKKVDVFNIFGECIHQRVSTPSEQIGTFSNLQIDLSSQPNGVYFIRVKTEKQSFSQKLVISR